MAKAFSIASWNVEHFKDDPARIDRVVQFLLDQKPDLFAIYEVEGKDVFQALTVKMPAYTFHITEGPQTQEILVGVKTNLTAFVTQRTEYQSGVFLLRPGMLATLTVDGANYPVLFLHTKSGDYPRDLGLRDDIFMRAVSFRGILDKAPGAAGRANYIFVGDFNTMGMKYRYVREEDIEVENELLRLDRMAAARQMHRLAKTSPTFWNGSRSPIPPSDLDQVVASDHLQFRTFQGGAEVNVRGWPEFQQTADQDQWISDYSDHALVYFEVQKVSLV